MGQEQLCLSREELALFLLHFFYFKITFYCCSIIVVPFFPLYSPLPYPSPTYYIQSSPNSFVFVHGSFIHVPGLGPSPSFPCYPPLPFPLVPVSLFLVSMPLVLFCSFVYFIHQVPLIGEIILYLSFATQLISLSIMLSSSIHAVAKGRSSFFLSVA